MLCINKLYVSVKEIEILKGLDLKVPVGQVHAIMGPNGSGKSTLSKVIAGSKDYRVNRGNILFDNVDITGLIPSERALRGIFLSFQDPVSIPGINNAYFLKTALNSKRMYENKDVLDTMDFLKLIKRKIDFFKINNKFLYRSLNENFSGGEKKINEIIQMSVLDPRLIILDEIDSGLDIDVIKIVSNGLNEIKKDKKRSMVIITHYRKFLDYINPDKVHIMLDGKIVSSGNRDLIDAVDSHGFDGFDRLNFTHQVN